jgi:hypothetical protein
LTNCSFFWLGCITLVIVMFSSTFGCI